MNLLPPKKDVALAFLERGLVRVFLDPRAREVVVPPHFKKQPQLILDIGLNLPIPIPDLQVDEAGITCTLSFDRPYHAFYCVLPWSCVFALVGDGQRSMIWPDDVPVEIQLSVKPAKAAPPEREAPRLSVVPPAPADDPAEDTKPADSSSGGGSPKLVDASGGAKLVDASGGAKLVDASAKTGDKAEKRKAKRAAKKAELRVAAPEAKPAATKKAVPAAAPSKPADSEDDSDSIVSPTLPPNKKKKRELPSYLRVVK